MAGPTGNGQIAVDGVVDSVTEVLQIITARQIGAGPPFSYQAHVNCPACHLLDQFRTRLANSCAHAS